MMKTCFSIGFAVMLTCGSALAQVETDLQGGGNTVAAMTMGGGEHVIIALHGAGGNDRRFFFGDQGGKMGQTLANAGFRVVAVTWSGQAGGGVNEVTTAIANARESGAKKISLMGHSRGGELAAMYARQQGDGVFDTVIQFSSVDDQGLPMTQTKKMFAFNKYDRWAKWQGGAFGKSAEPKQMIELGGSGHPVSALISEKANLAEEVIALLKK